MKKRVKLLIALVLMITTLGTQPTLGLESSRKMGMYEDDLLTALDISNPGKWYIKYKIRDVESKELVDGVKIKARYLDAVKDGNVIKEEIHYTDNAQDTYNLQFHVRAYDETIKRVEVLVGETLNYAIETSSGSTGPETSYGIRYLAEGGIFSDGNDVNLVKSYYGDTIDMYPDYEVPTKDGATFLGWENNKDEFWEMDRLLAKGDSPFTALWEYQKYDVTLNYNDGKEPVIIEGINHGSKLDEPQIQQRPGFEFLGWYKDAELNTPWDFDQDTVVENQTLYAGWQEQRFTVFFDSQGGTGILDIENVEYDAKILEPDEPFKDGFGFGGWFKDLQYNQEWKFDEDTVSSDTTLYAKWNEKIYTVEFDSNGGSKVNDATDIHHGTPVPKPKNPTRDGYSFQGWYRDESLNDAWDFKQPVTNDMTLYAKWEIKTYTVKFNSGQGSAVTDLKNIEHGSKILEPEEPFRDGYGFGGWFKESSLKNEWNFDEDQVTKNQTLYAKWNEKIYTVEFETNGGSLIDEMTDIPHGAIISVDQTTEKDHYTFEGWYEDEALLVPWENLGIINDTTLYAKWSINKYTVTFEDNGANENITPMELEYGTLIPEPVLLTKDNYTFKGWYVEEELVTPWDFLMPIEEDLTLFAKWELNEYTVTFDTNEGSEIEPIKHIKHGSLIEEPSEPFKEGYGFGGWYSDTSLQVPWDFSNDKVETDLILYAKWNHNEYTVDFISDGKIIYESSGIKHGNPVVEPVEPSKEGHSFAGWFIDDQFTDKWDFGTKVEQDMALYANWTVNEYTVRFETNGGSVVQAQTVEYNTTIEIPETSRVGYTLVGWYTDDQFTSAWDFNHDKVIDNQTLYAKWELNQYTLEFDANNNTEIHSMTINHGELVDKPSNPHKEGHTFVAWYHGETEWDFSTPVTDHMQLRAKWELNQYTVRFESNGGTDVEDKKADYGQKILEPIEPFKQGFGFGGWYQEASLTTPWYFDIHTVKDNITLYAKWNEALYTVEFESNGGSYVDEITDIHDGDVISQPDNPTKKGHDFIGWYKDKELTQAWTFETDKVHQDLILYAGWEDLQLIVNFNSMGGTKVDRLTKLEPGSLIEEPLDPIKTGYGFAGWFKGPWLSKQWDFTQDRIEKNMTLYAHWNEAMYTVEFESNGGTLIDDIVNVHAGDTIQKPENPSKEGYIFDQWYIDEELRTPWDFNNTIMGDTILYAGWIKDIRRFDVYFESNGGNSIEPQLGVEEGSLLPKPQDPSKPGYTFDAWYQDEALQVPWDFDNDTISQETKLYAAWIKDIRRFDVYFESNGGNSIEPQLGIEEGSLLPKPQDPSKPGYTFDAWYQDETLQVPWDFAQNTVSQQMTLYAGWMSHEDIDQENPIDKEDDNDQHKPETKPNDSHDLPKTGMGYSQALLIGAALAILGFIFVIFGKNKKKK
ncbi:InlB B-repeat-containing protein [Erysipelothrix urinaevulpis]|uniref:InlB B-repeat-containing protein n=1 Tax=Erysipelothrix urinaevulpis TaxID=2683717 RepID=UPI001358DBE7|nr:InlB B-repeat-containing protein [Erysipelothrix urinaevulpis]